jgi:hypothetical protein
VCLILHSGPSNALKAAPVMLSDSSTRAAPVGGTRVHFMARSFLGTPAWSRVVHYFTCSVKRFRAYSHRD